MGKMSPPAHRDAEAPPSVFLYHKILILKEAEWL